MQNKINAIKECIKREELNKRDLENELSRLRGLISGLQESLKILEQSTEVEVNEETEIKK